MPPRELIAHLIIVLALAAGGWMLVVEPVARRAAGAERALAETGAASARVDLRALEQFSARAEAIRSRLQALDRTGRLADDTGLLYTTLRDAARAAGVQVISAHPGSVHSTAPKASSESPAEPAARVRTAQMQVDGTPQAMATFFDGLQSLDAFLRPVAIVITPNRHDHGASVRAHITLELHTYERPDALARITDATS
ncbi:MAG: hypothetical protein KF817_09150 [Phycisphaeraceae bacterium]|nr:hypothetical protein [Phycisphaeraceae bacterium]